MTDGYLQWRNRTEVTSFQHCPVFHPQGKRWANSGLGLVMIHSAGGPLLPSMYRSGILMNQLIIKWMGCWAWGPELRCPQDSAFDPLWLHLSLGRQRRLLSPTPLCLMLLLILISSQNRWIVISQSAADRLQWGSRVEWISSTSAPCGEV